MTPPGESRGREVVRKETRRSIVFLLFLEEEKRYDWKGGVGL